MAAAVEVMSRRRWRKAKATIPVILHRALPPEAIGRIAGEHRLDRRFIGVDRHMRRWAVSQGSTMRLTQDELESLPVSRPTPLSDDEAILTDQVVLAAPDDVRRITFSWYRSPKPEEVIAEELNVTVRAVRVEHRLALSYLLGSLRQAGVFIPLWVSDP